MNASGQKKWPLQSIVLRKNPNEVARRSARVVTMLSELHKAGFQLLRVMPSMSPSGAHWRLAIGPVELFHRNHGAIMVSEFDLKSSSKQKLEALVRGVALYSSGQAGDGSFFGWQDAKQDDARELAYKFLQRFPLLAEHGRGWDYAYAGWYQRFCGLVEQGFFPYCFADTESPSRHGLHISNMRPASWGEYHEPPKLPLPPAGLLKTVYSFD